MACKLHVEGVMQPWSVCREVVRFGCFEMEQIFLHCSTIEMELRSILRRQLPKFCALRFLLRLVSQGLHMLHEVERFPHLDNRHGILCCVLEWQRPPVEG